MSKIVSLSGLGKKKQQSIMISIPSHRGVPMRETKKSVGEAMKYLDSKGYRVLFNDTTGANIAGNRNKGAEESLIADVDWLVFIDDDMVCEPDAIYRLIQHDLPVVGGLCVKKVWPFNTTIGMWIEEEQKYQMIYEVPPNELFECDGTGTAFLAIKTSVFRELEKPYFAFPPRNGSVLGEDLYFCQQVKKLGHKLYVDTGVIIGHLGFYPYTIADTLRVAEEVNSNKIALGKDGSVIVDTERFN